MLIYFFLHLVGYGGLGVSIEGPSKTEINCEDNGDGTCLVTYKPLQPGTYTIHVRYADKEIPGKWTPKEKKCRFSCPSCRLWGMVWNGSHFGQPECSL